MDNVDQEKAAPESKPASAAAARPELSTNKFAVARRASQQRKKKAHRRTLRRSNTKG
ncbi:MAG: hypothetical protein ABSD39_12185 [Terriglobales bacterium]|jgi:hypothetical protein